MMKKYAEVIEYLYGRLPMFTRDGAKAINKGLERTLAFCEHLGNPQEQFQSIHIAGTNGKGSSSHMLTSVLEAADYKTGLYTSPHLIDFRERIRVHGQMVDTIYVIDFIQKHQDFIEQLNPSFFEVTVAMAFDYFAQENVDIAIIEVGLGGRLDSTNIIQPLVSLITNIGLDHMDMLGATLTEIAGEKAGIIKSNVPVIVSEYHTVTAPVFTAKAAELNAPLQFGSQQWMVGGMTQQGKRLAIELENQRMDLGTMTVETDLLGSYQAKNVCGVLAVIDELRKLDFDIPSAAVSDGLGNVQVRTGLMGRWQTISEQPLIICDTGHNEDGIREVVKNLNATRYNGLHIVMGAMKDKDLSHILPLLPQEAIYYFCAPDMPRAMPAAELREVAGQLNNLEGDAYVNVASALSRAKQNYQDGDLIFIGGSTFVVAEVLQRQKC